METKIFTDNIDAAAEILRNGGLVAVPTETVYGLAGNALDEKAVREIYEVKGRPAVKPLSIMVPGKEAMKKYCEEVPQQAEKLAEKFWPGPLTIVLKSKDIVPELVRAGGATVGLRCPAHDMTLEALKKAGVPFAAPSANPSGEESPKDAEKVREYFDGKIDGILDGGPCGIGTESTILNMSTVPYRILRQGALEKKEIEDALVSEMLVIGITGGTGSGKTTALETLRSFGALVIDCDSVYHSLLENSGEMKAELKEAFPDSIVDDRIDRKRLGGIVFKDREALEKLNRITHFYVKQEIDFSLREAAMSGKRLAAIDAIELFSSGADKSCRYTVGVLADREKRIQRIVQRDGISRQYAASRVDAQKSDEYFREKCGYILENNGEQNDFERKCHEFFKELINNE